MFKSEDHKQGFQNLRQDYEILVTASSAVITRLAEKAMDTLMEQFADEIYGCFDDEFLTKAQAYMTVKGTDGDVDGFLDAYDALTKTHDVYFVWNGLVNGEEGMYALTAGTGEKVEDGWYCAVDGEADGRGPFKSMMEAQKAR